MQTCGECGEVVPESERCTACEPCHSELHALERSAISQLQAHSDRLAARINAAIDVARTESRKASGFRKAAIDRILAALEGT